MIRLLIEKEIRDQIHSTRFVLTFSACMLLIMLAFYMGAKNYQASMIQYEAAKRENLRQLEGVTDWLQVRQHRIFLRPQPLAALVTGVSNDIGRTVEVRGRGELTTEDSRYGDEPMFAVFRFLDLDFVFQIVLSLLAIVFAYDAVSGEKERGTLRLSFANAVPRATYILGKIIGMFLGVAVPLLLPILLGCLLLLLMGVHLTGDEWLRLGFIIGLGLLYVGAFLTLSIFVSSLTQRSSSSFLFLLTIWILATLVLPRCAILLAGRAVDVPSTESLMSQKSRLSAQLWSEDQKKLSNFTPSPGTKGEGIMKEFQKSMDDLSGEREKKLREFSSKLNEERNGKLNEQLRLSFTLARISPASSFSLAATSLAGSSLALKREYQEAANVYQQTYANFMVEKTGMNPGGGMVFMRMEIGGEKPKPINPAELPVFEPKVITMKDTLSDALFDTGILVVFNLMFFACAFVAFLKYDVR